MWKSMGDAKFEGGDALDPDIVESREYVMNHCCPG